MLRFALLTIGIVSAVGAVLPGSAAEKLNGSSGESYARSRALVVKELDDNKLLEFDIASEVAFSMLGARSVRQTFDGMGADEVIAWVKASAAPSYNEALKKKGALTPDELTGYLKVVREAALGGLPADDAATPDAVGGQPLSGKPPEVKFKQAGEAPVLDCASGAKFRRSVIAVADKLSDDERIAFVAALAVLEENLGADKMFELIDGGSGVAVIGMATSGYPQKMKTLADGAVADRAGALAFANTYIKNMTFATADYYRRADRFLDELSDADFIAFISAAGVLGAGSAENAVRLLYGGVLGDLVARAKTAAGEGYDSQVAAYSKLSSSSIRRVRKAFSRELDAAAKKYR